MGGIGKLANKKSCGHGKEGLEEILSKVTSILKGIGSWKPESEGHGMPQT